MTRPVVVTGIGLAAANGLGLQDYWAATLNGKHGIGRITRFDPSAYPATLAGEVPGFRAEEHLPRRLLAQTDPMTRLALTAADWALADARVVPEELPDHGMGVVTAVGFGGIEFQERELRKIWHEGRRASAFLSFAWFYAVNTGQISIHRGMRGAGGVLAGEQAAGLDTLAQARRRIRDGSPFTLAGAVESALSPWAWTGRLASEHLSTSAVPDRAYLPFDPQAAGHVPGEGGALLVLEDAESARRRGAAVYGEIAGHGATLDPAPGSDRPPGLRRAIEVALADAEAAPGDIDVVFADAAALPAHDRAEADALNAVFGPGGVPVTAPKTMTGRLCSGGAPLDVAAALLALRHQIIPPTVHTAPDPAYRLDLVVGLPRPAPLRTALVLARDYGGYNSALVLRAPAERGTERAQPRRPDTATERQV